MSRDRLVEARKLIEAKRYEEGAAILRTLPNDPTAQKWLAQMEVRRLITPILAQPDVSVFSPVSQWDSRVAEAANKRPLSAYLFDVLILLVGFLLGLGTGYLFFERSASAHSDPVDVQRAENQVELHLQNSELIASGVELVAAVASSQGFAPVAIATVWTVGEYRTEYISPGRYQVRVSVDFDPQCSSEATGCEAYFSNYSRWDFFCESEWLVLIETQEILPQNQCSQELHPQRLSK